jgi:hypothetical protein
LNAGLNDVPNIEIREGSFFEPVGDERFDWIASNPPYVIAPEADLVFRYSPSPRDEVSRTVLAEAARHLEDGGYAHALCNWIVPAGEAWDAPPRRWLDGLGCDALLLHHATEDPLAYAVRWNARLQQLAPDRYGTTLDRWLDYYERERIEAICSGAVILRRRDAPRNWVHTIEIGSAGRGSASPQILAIVAGQDYLANVPDERALLADSFRPVDPHRLDQALLFRDDRYTIGAASLVHEEGLGVRATVEPALTGLVLRMDGVRTLGELIDEIAAETNVDREEIATAGLTLVRALLGLGFLVRP